MKSPRSAPSFLLLMLLAVSGLQCTSLQQLTALKDVDFSIDRVSSVTLGGVSLDGIQSYQDLAMLDLARLGTAVLQKDLPLELNLHLNAQNPPDNSVSAKMVKMDWTLLLDDRETISGVFDDTIVLPPGEPQDVSIPISLNLVDFFENSLKDLGELALSVAGQGGSPKRIKLQAMPTIETPFGPMRYPNAITIVSKEVGGTR